MPAKSLVCAVGLVIAAVAAPLRGDRLSSEGSGGSVIAGTSPPQNATPPATQPTNPRDRWNKEYDNGIPALRNPGPSEFLATVVKGRTPGTVLDLGIGQGRNAIFLAGQGWKVTGVDVSDSAVALARKNAAARGVTIEMVVADLDAFDFGSKRWDLITSFYMHSWHKNSKTNVPERLLRALKPGGIVVMEAFRRPPNTNGFVTAELTELFRSFRIIRNDESTVRADWGPHGPAELVRFIAEKPVQ